MKLNVCTSIMMGLTVGAMSLPLHARTILEVGSEYEQYFDETDSNGKVVEYEKLSNYSPYVTLSHTPNSNEWNLWGRLFYKEYLHEDQYKDNIPTGQTERAEFTFTKFYRTGNLRLRPAFGIRYNGYETDRSETEYRFYPSFDYFLNGTDRLFLSGFAYVGDTTAQRSGDKASQDYVDWGYEYETGYLYYFNSNNSLKVGLYGEFDSFENNVDSELLQFRVMYDKKIGRVNFKPYFQYGIYRNMTEKSHNLYERWGSELDKSYDRYGIEGRIGISGQFGVTFNTYWQIEKNDSYNTAAGGVIELPDRDKFFAKVGIQYIF